MPEKEQNVAEISRRKFLWLGGISLPTALYGTASDQASKRDEEAPVRAEPAEAWSSLEPWVEIDCGNLGYNLDRIREKAGVPVMAVVKAEAYGHGLLLTARELEKKGVSALMVGKLAEALRLRLGGIRTAILNFGPFDPGDAESLVANNISQSVFTDTAVELAEAASRIGGEAAVHIHIDTGMGRAGIPSASALPFLKRMDSLASIRIVGLSTTLTEDPEFDAVQIRRFLSLSREAEEAGIELGLKHAASSGGLMTMPSSYLDMVRPGIALYGYYPSDASQKEDQLALRPVLSLKSRVHAVKTLNPGDSVSYHRAYRAKKKERIALITLGYSDGYPSQASKRAHVLIRGRRYPVIAGITANHTEVLLGDDRSVVPGDEVIFIGRQGDRRITAFDVAGWAGISVYKVLIGINPLLPRKSV